MIVYATAQIQITVVSCATKGLCHSIAIDVVTKLVVRFPMMLQVVMDEFQTPTSMTRDHVFVTMAGVPIPIKMIVTVRLILDHVLTHVTPVLVQVLQIAPRAMIMLFLWNRMETQSANAKQGTLEQLVTRPNQRVILDATMVSENISTAVCTASIVCYTLIKIQMEHAYVMKIGGRRITTTPIARHT